MMPKGRERQKEEENTSSCQEHCGIRRKSQKWGVPWTFVWVAPRPLVSSVISRGKCDQLMRFGAAEGIECLCARGGESTGASLLRRVLRFEALRVGVGREAVLVDT